MPVEQVESPTAVAGCYPPCSLTLQGNEQMENQPGLTGVESSKRSHCKLVGNWP